jgi:hypothetical protein
MKICVVYVYPKMTHAPAYDNAFRFLDSYHKHPSGIDHELIVVCQSFSPDEETKLLFGNIPGVSFFEHDNSGWDIGAYQHVARDVKCDMMAFFGSSAYVRGNGWLSRMAEAFSINPTCIYGSMQHYGALSIGVYPHIRTSGFWLNPNLLLQYPVLIHSPEQRYGFEHGPNSFTGFCYKRVGALVATWHGLFGPDQWNNIIEGYHNGDQKEMITGDKNSMPPFYPVM